MGWEIVRAVFGQTASVERGQADEISSEVHDLWFDADSLPNDPVEGQVQLPLYRGRARRILIARWERPPKPGDPQSPVCVLTIRSVRSLTLEDGANIGWYSIQRFGFDPDENVIRVECNEPLTLTLSVSELDAELIT